MAGGLRKTMVYLGLAEDVSYGDDVYDEYEDDQTRPYPSAARTDGSAEGRGQVTAFPQRALARVPNPPEGLQRITTIHPRTYNDAKTIGEAFREATPVIMNLTDMGDADAKRLVDFAAGLVFGLHGAIERVTAKVFLLSPAHVEVTAEDRDGEAVASPFNQS